jgi:hypothetical protein
MGALCGGFVLLKLSPLAIVISVPSLAQTRQEQ